MQKRIAIADDTGILVSGNNWTKTFKKAEDTLKQSTNGTTTTHLHFMKI